MWMAAEVRPIFARRSGTSRGVVFAAGILDHHVSRALCCRSRAPRASPRYRLTERESRAADVPRLHDASTCQLTDLSKPTRDLLANLNSPARSGNSPPSPNPAPLAQP